MNTEAEVFCYVSVNLCVFCASVVKKSFLGETGHDNYW
jgi:hypothetical protein